MIALQITSMKQFMNELLTGDAFDIFLLEEATISTAITISIDGHVNVDFYPIAERTPELLPYEYQPWSEMKGLCFDLIKGKRTPLNLKFVMQLKPDKVKAMLEKEKLASKAASLKSLVLTIKYDGGKAILTTGSSYQTFVMDKTADVVWDRQISKYLAMKGIQFEIL
ncbi:MAG: hypothetical protein J6X14_05965 [Lachnospiraceae bacterium]|nr:hypothetical protein [Lachnospiraceae bacterium]MBP5669839.1 hypothetical protein [Lachnospiraceae bacterium]MBR4734129.1 hypothetical protein [Lachnospiraceae bacterium]